MWPIFWLLLSPIVWLATSLLQYFLLALLVTIGYRYYCTGLARIRRRLSAVDSRKVILITGATSGIGLAVAKHLWSLGYSLAIGCYATSEPGYQELKELQQNRSAGNKQQRQRMLFLMLDVSDDRSVAEAYETLEKHLGDNQQRLFALVNNAGLGSLVPFAWLPKQDMFRLLDTNLTGAMRMTREFLPLLIKAEGRIVNVSSGLGLLPGDSYATYGITKSSLIYLTKALNAELREPFNVRSVAVLPHNFIKNTNIGAQISRQHKEGWQSLKPAERSLYRKEYERHSERLLELDRAMASRDKAASGRPRRSNADVGDSFIGKYLAGPVRGLLRAASGQNVAESLEESGMIESFELALRLQDPPELLFAGDNCYSLLVGSLLLTVPPSCVGLLSASVSRSLYR